MSNSQDKKADQATKIAALRKSLKPITPLYIEDEIQEDLNKRGRVPKWVNDRLSRIDSHLRMGYEFVLDREGQKISEVVYYNGPNKGDRAYLMSIDSEDRKLLIAEKNRDVDDIEQRIHKEAKLSHPKGGLFADN